MPLQMPEIIESFEVTGTLPPPTTGQITFTVSGNPPTSVQLSGLGSGWSTDEQGIRLTPDTSPTLYQLTLQLVQPPQQQTFSLVGVKIRHHREDNPSTEDAAIFIPASSDQAVLNLLHQIPSTGETVTYGMFVGLFDGTTTFWPDPTISFDPQGG